MEEALDPQSVMRRSLETAAQENVGALAAKDAGYLQAAAQCVAHWRLHWCASEPVSVGSALVDKFKVCYPLAAHALNHVESALELRDHRPWVATSSARVAFEHAIAAEWVFHTKNGLVELINCMKSQSHLYAKDIADELRGNPDYDDVDLEALVGERPQSGWSVYNGCGRFSNSKLFYAIYRNLSQAEHPSQGLLAAHLEVTSNGRLSLNSAGAQTPCSDLPMALGMSATWAVDVLERLRDGSPFLVEVDRIGRDAQLPTDLRASDQHPERQ
jgi:hypothetical protein